MEEKISLLIPTMNRPDTLKKTLDGYMLGSVIPSQIVVVDQSQDVVVANEVAALVKEYQKKTEIVYIFQKIPSLTKARNTAMRYAMHEIIICSDDDVDVYSNTLENIVEIMQKEKIAMIAGIDDNASKSKSNIGYLLGTKSFKNRKIGHITMSMLGRYPDKIVGQIPTQWAMGYFFVIRKSLINQWDLSWDEKLVSYAYAEDLDFSFSYYKKAKEEGYQSVLDERVRVKHLVSKEYRIPSKKSTYMYVINRAYLSYKHKMGIKSQIALNWCNFWRLLERILKRENPRDFLEAKKICKKLKKNNFLEISSYLE